MWTVNDEKRTTTEDAAVNNNHRSSKTFEGKLVSVSSDKLVMTNMQGTESSHTMATNASFSCDDAVCAAADLKVGSRIRVTTEYEDFNVVTSVEALDKSAGFGNCC